MARWTYCLFLALVMFLVTTAAEARPIRVSQVNALIEDGKTPAQVIDMMREYGVGFRMDRRTEDRFKDWGFSADQIQTVKNIIDGTDVPPAKPGEDPADQPGAPGGNPDAAPNQPDRPLARPRPGPNGEFPVGYVLSPEFHAAEKARVQRAIAASVGYQRHELNRVTLYCSDRRARRLVPLLKKLEEELIATFPSSLANACDPRSAHIVIVDGDSEWNNWVEACFNSYEQDGITYRFGPDADPRPQLKRGSGYMLPHLAAVHADKLKDEELVARFAAYDVGHLMMIPASAGKGPDTLTTGFGDYTETLAFGNPSVTVYSYIERENAERAQMTWKQIVQQRFKNGDIKTAHHVWNYTTDSMKLHQYAEAWSLVSTLCEAPDKFAKAVQMVQTEEQKSMAKAIEAVYEINERQLTEAWFRFVSN